MSRQSLPQLIVEAQQLLTQILQYSQYQALQFNCDITLGDLVSFSIPCNLNVKSKAIRIH
ncbi:hypothetical protein ACWATR_36270 [Nostoc sp. UIC 10890]